MNRTKFLTSLSALAAVFAFNGNAMAVTSASPSCSPNEYKLDYSKVPSSDWVSSCGSQTTQVDCTYGATGVAADDLCKAQVKCAQQQGKELLSWDVYKSATISETNRLTNVAPGAVIGNTSLANVSDGGTLYLMPNYETLNYLVRFDCDASENIVEGGVDQGDITISGSDTINLKTYCGVPGYYISNVVIKRDGSTIQGNVSGRTVYDPETGVFNPSAIGLTSSELKAGGPFLVEVAYSPMSFEVPLYRDTTKLGDFIYTNRASLTDSPVWQYKANGGTAVNASSGVSIAVRNGYTLRAATKTKLTDVSTTQSESIASNIWVPIASGSTSTAPKFAALPVPNNGGSNVVTSGDYFPSGVYTAWAKNCDTNIESATCELAITPSTGVVTYTNACKPGFNTLK